MRTWALGAAFCILFVSAFARGVVEALSDKTAAYAVQVVGVFVSLVAIVLLSRFRVSTRKLSIVENGDDSLFQLGLLMILASALSAVFTAGSGKEPVIAYFVVLAYPVGIRYLMRQISIPSISEATLVWPLLGALWAAGLVALAQQMGVEAELPGVSDYLDFSVRPPSVTGSYLHYPLVISLGSLIAVFWFACGPSVVRALVSLPLLVFWAASLGRSGYFIVVATCVIEVLRVLSVYLAEGRAHPRELRLSIWPVASIAAVCVALILVDQMLFEGLFLERLISAADPESAGNDTRVSLWLESLDTYFDGPLLIGNLFGLVTNLSRNIVGVDTPVVESSFLQQLLNVGLIGTIAYYGIFWRTFREIADRHPRWFGSAFIAAMLQTLVYQSIEVIPFITLVMLFPLFGAVVGVGERGRLAHV